jgi:hypothetical protein
MTPKQFDKSVRNVFGSVLQEHGFSLDESQYCTFHRKTSEDVYHFVVPDLGSRGTWYDIRVFHASPIVDPLFFEQFPDEIGIPSDSYSYLSERGIGLDQERFNCKSEESFLDRFERTVCKLLTVTAVKYLDQFQAIEDMLPIIKSPMFLGIALHQIGRIAEALPLLEQQYERLSATGSSERTVTARLEHIGKLLHLQ